MARNRGTPKERNRRNPEGNYAVEKDSAANPANEAPTGAHPSHDDIARRAYQLYERRGAEQGHEQEDWLEAERELRESTEGTQD